MLNKHASRAAFLVALSCAAVLYGAPPERTRVASAAPALRFEPNVGQTDAQVRFLSGSRNGDVFLTPGEIVLSVRRGGENAAVRLHILDANPNPRVVGLDRLPGVTNYFLGNDPKKWRTNVPSFAKVKYTDVYPGIDLVAYGNQGNLEYDFEVAPGADPRQIAMSIEGAGADRNALDAGGDVVLRTALGEIRQCAPRIYQRDDAGTHEIAGGYVVREAGTVAFTLAAYDATRPLIIDPQLAFSTYFGGSAETDIHALTVDSTGAIYVAGDTYAHDFPTKNPEQAANGHDQSLSAIVSKFSSDGASLVYSTYLGGSGGSIDVAVGITVDSTGAAYVTGNGGSLDFPTKNSILGKGNGIFVTKLSADGSSLVYSSVYGGSGFDNPRGIVLDGSNDAYIFGDTQSTDFPTVNPTQPASGGGGYKDGFWSIVSTDGSQLLFSTYVGGNNDDDVRSLIVNPKTGDVYLGGETQSNDFAGNDGSLVPYHMHFQFEDAASSVRRAEGLPDFRFRVVGGNLWILKVGTATYVPDLYFIGVRIHPWEDDESAGNPSAQAERDKAQQADDIEVLLSPGCVPVPPATSCSGNASVVFADAETLEVKSAIDLPDTVPPITAVSRDSHGVLYAVGAAGRTSTPPLVEPIQAVKGGGDDGFVMVLAAKTREILFSTYLGGGDDDEPNGVAVDAQGNIYVAGQTQSSDFPTKNALQPTAPAPNGASIGDGNSFIVKISSGAFQPVSRKPVVPPKPRRESTRDLPPRPVD